MAPLNVFVTDGHAEIYLSKSFKTFDPAERDNLLRLSAKEEANMGISREHVESGKRRVIEGRRRVMRQRIIVARLPLHEGPSHPARLRLATLEKTQQMLEGHLALLRKRQEQTKL